MCRFKSGLNICSAIPSHIFKDLKEVADGTDFPVKSFNEMKLFLFIWMSLLFFFLIIQQINIFALTHSSDIILHVLLPT